MPGRRTGTKYKLLKLNTQHGQANLKVFSVDGAAQPSAPPITSLVATVMTLVVAIVAMVAAMVGASWPLAAAITRPATTTESLASWPSPPALPTSTSPVHLSKKTHYVRCYETGSSPRQISA